MRIKCFVSASILLILFVFVAQAQSESDSRKIYIIRHAEKTSVKEDPELTEAGKERAETLKRILSDKEIEKVYSTDTKRTRGTIMPFADEEGMGINLYSAKNHGDLVEKLFEDEGNVVVIGHSNTIHLLVNLLMDTDEMEELDESDYENIFIVLVDDEGETRLEKKRFSDFKED
jgi:broad specificity phosphatase PhoE